MRNDSFKETAGIVEKITTSKPHYAVLDGLRGVAALMVVWYHIFEGFATSAIDQRFNHGYLAVDFFFILSGFVIGYAYDDRWSEMKNWGFFRKRLIRLHPMVILGAVAGTAAFLIQGGVRWDGSHVSLWAVAVSMVMAFFLIPCSPGSFGEIRGNGEMFPLNGPSWSLFFEYIANIMYALFLRKLSIRMLKVFVTVSGLGYAAFAVFNGSGAYSMGVGWTLGGLNFLGGMLRVSFAFSCGLLLSRNFGSLRLKSPVSAGTAFWISGISIIALLSVPYISVSCSGNMLQPHWLNGLYDAVCTIIIFPSLVLLGASATKGHSGICSLLGEISYPMYMIHYPIMYLFYAWVWKNSLTFSQAWPVALCIFIVIPVLAYICLKAYDIPVRRWLERRSSNNQNTRI